ncbi:hypothetical protein BC827DRAFT_1271823 [Russula dissimulans]|nr:hypothetical protein BC827DRAFT_1271823 [Russula dissimulans]
MAHPPSTRDLLYTHGTIARTLGARDAALYFTRLLRVDERALQPLFHHEWPEAFFTNSPTVPSAYPSVYTPSNRPAWLLDYVVRNYGTVVPQRIWSPGTAADAQRYNNVALNMPIFFVHNDRMTLGLQLVSAAAGHCVGLMNGRATAPVGTCHTTSIRIKWPGYSEWTTQIMTRDQTSAHRTIPLEKLAKRLARAVCKFLEFVARQQCQYPDWQVGGGGITSNDIILIGFIHVTQGSWQPILQLNRYIISGSPHM